MKFLCKLFLKPFQKNTICVKRIDLKALRVGAIDLKLNFTLKKVMSENIFCYFGFFIKENPVSISLAKVVLRNKIERMII